VYTRRVWFLGLFISIVGAAAFIYLAQQLEKVKAKVDELRQFQHDLIRLAENPARVIENIQAYLHMKHSHHMDDIVLSVMPREEQIVVDSQALKERNQKEVQDLVSKLVKELWCAPGAGPVT
jgi:hypothetical protein